MSKYQAAKTIVRDYFEALENASPENVADVLQQFTGENYLWRGVYPFREQRGADTVAEGILDALDAIADATCSAGRTFSSAEPTKSAASSG